MAVESVTSQEVSKETNVLCTQAATVLSSEDWKRVWGTLLSLSSYTVKNRMHATQVT